MDISRDISRHHKESLRELRYLVAGVDALGSSTATIATTLDRDLPTTSTRLSEIGDYMWQVVALANVQAQVQREIGEMLRSPLGTAATELLKRAASAAERQLWQEAIRDYDLSIERNWDQPEAHLGRGSAILGAISIGERSVDELTDAADSFQRALRYGAQTKPAIAVRAVQLAVAVHDRLGQRDVADSVLRDAVERLPQSPELAFSAGLRFGVVEYLDQAVRLDPTLVADSSWSTLRIAAPVVKRLDEAQQAAVKRAIAALNAAEDYGYYSDEAVPSGDDLPTRLNALRQLDGQLKEAQQILSQPTAEEEASQAWVKQLDREIAMADKSAEAEPTERVSSSDWLISGVAGLVVFCAGSVVLSLVAGSGDGSPPRSLPVLLILVAGIVVGWPLARKHRAKRVTDDHTSVERSLLAERADHDAERASYQAGRMATAGKVSRAADEVSRLVRRSPDAYPI